MRGFILRRPLLGVLSVHNVIDKNGRVRQKLRLAVLRKLWIMRQLLLLLVALMKAEFSMPCFVTSAC